MGRERTKIMDIEGNLEVMDLPTLIQFIGQEGSEAVIQLKNDAKVGCIYLKSGLLCHAELTRNDEIELAGEDAIYAMLGWPTGRFKVEKEIESPASTIEQPWDFVLMEGIRRLDEEQAPKEEIAQAESASEQNLSTSTAGLKLNLPALNNLKEIINMANLEETLNGIMSIGGAKAAALVDWESGLTLGTVGGGIDIDLAAAGNTNVVRAKMGVMKDLKIKGGIEDILITLNDQYHIIRLLEDNSNLFIYVAFDRATSNLGMARHKLSALEKELAL